MDLGDMELERRFEEVRNAGKRPLRHFINEVREKRRQKSRELSKLDNIAEERSRDYDQHEEDELWTQHAKMRVEESDARLAELLTAAYDELDRASKNN